MAAIAAPMITPGRSPTLKPAGIALEAIVQNSSSDEDKAKLRDCSGSGSKSSTGKCMLYYASILRRNVIHPPNAGDAGY